MPYLINDGTSWLDSPFMMRSNTSFIDTARKFDLLSRSQGMLNRVPSRLYISPPASLSMSVLAAMSTTRMEWL